jgi:hypothetical protein
MYSDSRIPLPECTRFSSQACRVRDRTVKSESAVLTLGDTQMRQNPSLPRGKGRPVAL